MTWRTVFVADTDCKLTTKDALEKGEKIGQVSFGPATRAVNAHYSAESRGWHVDVENARLEPVQNAPRGK